MGKKLGCYFYARIENNLFSETLLIGISSSGISNNIKIALDFAMSQGINTSLITENHQIKK